MEWETELAALGFTVEPCGSRVTCTPAPTDTDQDYLVAFEGEAPRQQMAVSKLMDILGEAGFKWEGDTEHYQNSVESGFMSWRKGEVNLIVTASLGFARRHRLATRLCKRLNLLNKDDRIALFQAVLYGN